MRKSWFLVPAFFAASALLAEITGIITEPGGSDTQVQFNNAGTFGGDSDMTFSTSTNRLTISSAAATFADISTATFRQITATTATLTSVTITTMTVSSFTATSLTAGSITDTGLTSGRVPYAGTGGLLQDDSDFTFNGTTLSVGGLSNTGNSSLTGSLSGSSATMSGALSVTGATTLSSLTATRVPYAGTGGLLQDVAGFTHNGTTLTIAGLVNTGNTSLTGSLSGGAGSFTSLTDSGLTATRVPYAGTGGLLQDDADMTFNGSTISVTGISASTGVLPLINSSVAIRGPKPWIDVTAHGVTGDGSTIDTTALQAVFNAITQDSVIYLPANVYMSSGTVTYSGSYDLTIKGDGQRSTQLLQGFVSTDTFKIATTAHVEFQDLWIKNVNAPAAGAGIKFVGGSGGAAQVDAPVVTNCRIEGQWDGLDFLNANQFQVWGNNFVNGYHAEILADDDESNDSEIIGNFMVTAISTSNAGVMITNSPGLRISSNKILGYKYGVLLSLESDIGPLNINANSIENQALAGIFITTATAGASIGSVNISGNEFAQHTYGIFISTDGAIIENLGITGNTFATFTDGVHIAGGATNITVAANDFHGGTIGIYNSGSATIASGGSNGFWNVTTPINAQDYARLNGALSIGASTTTISKLMVEDSSTHFYLKQSNNDNGWIIGTSNADGNLHMFRRGEGGSPTNNERVTITTVGDVGISTTGPTAQLTTTGSVRFANFGAGTATFDANGNVSSVSDARMKDLQGPYTRGLGDILKITPQNYKWKKSTGFDMEHVYSGFIAQDVLKAIPEAVWKNKDGFYSLQDRPIMSALVNAIKELSAKSELLERKIADLEKRLKKAGK